MQNFQGAEVVLKKLFKHSCLCFDTITVLSSNVATFMVPVAKIVSSNCSFPQVCT